MVSNFSFIYISLKLFSEWNNIFCKNWVSFQIEIKKKIYLNLLSKGKLHPNSCQYPLIKYPVHHYDKEKKVNPANRLFTPYCQV